MTQETQFGGTVPLALADLTGDTALLASKNKGHHEVPLSVVKGWLNPRLLARATDLDGYLADLDPATGQKVEVGGPATDNAGPLKDFLVTGVALGPVTLTVNGADVGHSGLVTPGWTRIEGLGRGTTLYSLAGSNSFGLRSKGIAPNGTAAEYAAAENGIFPGGEPSGGPVELANLTFHGNHGTYPGGNASPYTDASMAPLAVTSVVLVGGTATVTLASASPYPWAAGQQVAVAGTTNSALNGTHALTGYDAAAHTMTFTLAHADVTGTGGTVQVLPLPDARGPYAQNYWLTGLFLWGHSSVHLENVHVIDSPSYGGLYGACPEITIIGGSVQQSGTDGPNTDGDHFLSGTKNGRVFGRLYKNLFDDPNAVNVDEAGTAGGSQFLFSGCVYENCTTVLRVYGYGSDASHVQNFGATGTVRTGALVVGSNVGNPVSGLPDASHQVTFADFDLTFLSTATYVAVLFQNAGAVTVRGKAAVGGGTPIPAFRLDGGKTSSATLDLEVQRSDQTGAGGCLLAGTAPGSGFGHVGTLTVKGFRSLSQFGKSYTAIPALVSLTDVASIERLVVESLDAPDAPAMFSLLNSSYVRRCGGPGWGSVSDPIHDAQALPGTQYQSADLGGPAYKTGAGHVFDYTAGALKTRVEGVNDQLWLILRGGSATTDASGYRRVLTAFNGPTVEAGEWGGSRLVFNGTNQRIDISNDSLTAYGLPSYEWKFGTNSWEFTARLTVVDNTRSDPILTLWGTGGGAPASFVFFLYATPGGALTIGSKTGGGAGGQVDTALAAGIANNTPGRIFFGYDGANFFVKWNGSALTTLACADPASGGGNAVQVAADTADSAWGKIKLQDAAVFRGNLSPAQRAAIVANAGPVL